MFLSPEHPAKPMLTTVANNGAKKMRLYTVVPLAADVWSPGETDSKRDGWIGETLRGGGNCTHMRLND